MLNAARKQDMRYGAIQKAEESVSRFIPYTRHVDENTLKTGPLFLERLAEL